MNQWPCTKARLVLAALLPLGWSIKRQSGTSHKVLRQELLLTPEIIEERNWIRFTLEYDLEKKRESGLIWKPYKQKLSIAVCSINSLADRSKLLRDSLKDIDRL